MEKVNEEEFSTSLNIIFPRLRLKPFNLIVSNLVRSPYIPLKRVFILLSLVEIENYCYCHKILPCFFDLVKIHPHWPHSSTITPVGLTPVTLTQTKPLFCLS